MQKSPFILIAILFFTLPALAQPSGGANPFQRITAPQVVTGDGFTTEIVLLNTASTTCLAGINYHLGAGTLASDPLLTNGQNLGNSFTQQLPPLGTLILEVTNSRTGMFEGAASVDILNPACFQSVNVQTQYRNLGPQNQLLELFSYPTPISVPLQICAAAPVNFDPDPTDGSTVNPGLANVSLNPLSGVLRFMELRDDQGNLIDQRPPEPYDGHHDTGLLNDFFPNQGAFNGSWRVCFTGQQPATLGDPVRIDTLFIDVEQRGGDVQFDSNDHSLVNPGCMPNDRTMCLEDKRYQVNVEWSNPPLIDQPGFVQDIKPDDTGFFFFLDPGNTELIVKVLDGCSFNNRFWVFYAATTDVEFTITVTDTRSNQTKQFTNPLGQPADAVVDTDAFATCP